jgi:hypothetical protein
MNINYQEGLCCINEIRKGVVQGTNQFGSAVAEIIHIFTYIQRYICVYIYIYIHKRFYVFTAVTMTNDVSWDVTQCGSSKNRVSEERST